MDLLDRVREDANLSSDGCSRQRKVTRDHHEPDTRTSTDPHRLCRVVPRWIDERDEADKDDGRVESDQDVLERRGIRERLFRDGRRGDDLLGEEQDALSLTGKGDLSCRDRGDGRFVEQDGGAVEAQVVRTAAEEDVGRSFDQEEVVGLVERLRCGERRDGGAGGGLDELERKLVLRPHRISTPSLQHDSGTLNSPCC